MHMRSHAATLESNINVTPLVDVCLVLLIIFMVVTPILNGDIPVHLPKTANGEKLAPEQLKITVNADGTVFVGAVALRSEQVASELQRMHDREPMRPVAVRGDKSVSYGSVVKVLDAARGAGYRDVALVSDSATPAQVR